MQRGYARFARELRTIQRSVPMSSMAAAPPAALRPVPRASTFGVRLSGLHSDPRGASSLELHTRPTILSAIPIVAQELAPINIPAPTWFVEEMIASSTLKKRRLKMNKHKTRKRRKRDRNRTK